MNILLVLGSSGGIVAFLSAVVIIGRGIFRQVAATEDNTKALQGLTDEVHDLKTMTGSHETRITVLEDRDRRQRRGSYNPRPD